MGDPGEDAKKALTPEERIARHRKKREESIEAEKASNASKMSPGDIAIGVTGCSVILLAVAGIGVLFLRGCEYIRESSKENDARALICIDARERLDQVKRLRNNGLASQSAVRAMERQHREACTR